MTVLPRGSRLLAPQTARSASSSIAPVREMRSKTAARDRKTGEIKYFPPAEFDRIVQINLVGTFRCIAHAAPEC